MISVLPVLYLLFSYFSFGALQTDPAQVLQVADRLYMISGLGGNVSFLVTQDGVLVVDAGNSPRAGNKILHCIAEKTQSPLVYLAITHYHGDHTDGMQVLSQEKKIIGHKNLIKNLHERKEVRQKESVEKLKVTIRSLELEIAAARNRKDSSSHDQEQMLEQAKQNLFEKSQVKIVEPNVCFDTSYTLVLGKDTIDFMYPGPAHTQCNIVVYFRTQKVLQTGDIVFNGSFPYILWQDGINTENWSLYLRKIAQDGRIRNIIPGHGALAEPKELLSLANYLYDLRAEVKTAMHAGKSLEEMKKELQFPKYKNFKGHQLIDQNIESVYHVLGGQ